MYKLSDIFKTDNIEQKRKILSNFPITREDRNKTLVASMNISDEETDGTNGIVPKFYKINKDVDIFGTSSMVLVMYSNLIGFTASESDDGKSNYVIAPIGSMMLLPDIEGVTKNIHTISFIPIKSRTMNTNEVFEDYVYVNTIYDFTSIVPSLTKEDIDNAFIEITEEEFYNFNPNSLPT